MNANKIITILHLNGKCIVKVQSCCSVDGERGEVGQIDAERIIEQGLTAALKYCFCLLSRLYIKGYGQIVAEKWNVDVFLPNTASVPNK